MDPDGSNADEEYLEPTPHYEEIPEGDHPNARATDIGYSDVVIIVPNANDQDYQKLDITDDQRARNRAESVERATYDRLVHSEK